MVSAFQDETGADQALMTLEGEDQEIKSAIHATAVILRDAANVLQIREAAGWSGGSSPAAGALIGGAIGILFPPDVLVTGPLGATIGDLGVRLSESGFPDAQFKAIGESLGPGTSAIIAIVAQESIARLERGLTDQGAMTVHESISADLAAGLAHPQPTSAPVSPTSKTNADEAASRPQAARWRRVIFSTRSD
jgi:uncharacterized membrane protein